MDSWLMVGQEWTVWVAKSHNANIHRVFSSLRQGENHAENILNAGGTSTPCYWLTPNQDNKNRNSE
jgi:hypothetical protein